MPRRSVDSATDFKGSMKKLVVNLKPFLPLIIPAFILAMISAIFSIIGPGKLSDITDIITEGMVTGIDLDRITKIGIFLIIIYSLSTILVIFKALLWLR